MSWEERMPCQPVTDEEAWLAVWNGEVEGDYYVSDDETWANVTQLAAWRVHGRR